MRPSGPLCLLGGSSVLVFRLFGSPVQELMPELGPPEVGLLNKEGEVSQVAFELLEVLPLTYGLREHGPQGPACLDQALVDLLGLLKLRL
jgi:hypothetical protein